MPQELRKLFVLGLGTTGTDVCNMLAERLENEFGSLDRIPWVQFLCFETDASKGGLMSQRDCMMPLTISGDEYQGLLADTTALDAEIHFSRYWDTDTLKNIPDIMNGVGNVRMAGRLAFFYPNNFSMLENRLITPINDLVDLAELDAQKKRGPLPGGDNPPIHFLGNMAADPADAGQPVTVLVVGTLCGGTGSGLCVDLGYYLRDRCPGVKVMSIFTLPRPDLSVDSGIKNVERIKCNSYAALQELHHYSQIGDVEYVAKYSGQEEEFRKRGFPYELTMLAWPRHGTKEGPDALGAAIAERLFLMSFAGTDPFAIGVDVAGQYGPPGRKTTHTAFGSLGLSTLEHPGPRLADGCAYRLLGHMFGKWAGRAVEPVQTELEVQAMGITWDHLRRDADLAAGSPELRVQAKADQTMKALAKGPDGFKKELDQIGLAFGDANGAIPDPALEARLVPHNLQQAQARGSIAAALEKRVSDWLDVHLMRWDYGPAVCLKAVDAAIIRLTEIGAQPAPGDPDDAKLRAAADQMGNLSHDGLVKFTFLDRRAAADIANATRAAARQHVALRFDAAVRRVLDPHTDPEGFLQPGALEDARQRLKRTRRRLQHLTQASQTYGEFCVTRAGDLAEVPKINGQILMRADQADQEYRRCLAGDGDDKVFAAAQDAAAVRLLRTWADVPAAITASTPTFYDNPPPVGRARTVGDMALHATNTHHLLQEARKSFALVLEDDVITRWNKQENPEGIVRKLVSDAAPFCDPNTTTARSLLRDPPPDQKVAIYPGHETQRADAGRFRAALRNAFHLRASASPYRATLLNEYFGLPLEAFPGIVRTAGVNYSLEAATFTKWRTTARLNEDGWLPISPAQRERLAKYHRLLAVGIVLGLLEVEGGFLKLPSYSRGGDFGDVNYRLLPPSLDAAARRWALDGRDSSPEERDLLSMETVLTTSIGTMRQPNHLGNLGLLRRIEQNLPTAGAAMASWNEQTVARLIREYCLDDVQLRGVYYLIFGPSPLVRGLMFYQVGDATVVGPCQREGFHCLNVGTNTGTGCNGYLGADETTAASLGWKCPKCGTEYHSVAPTYKNEWIHEAAALKSASPQPHYTADPVTRGGQDGTPDIPSDHFAL